MLKLKFKDQRKPAIWLVESVTTLGSDARSHVQITEPGVEPLHASITKEGDALYLSDAGTAQGTYVNEQRIRQKFQLRAGDQLKIAGVELEILDPKQSTDTTVQLAGRSDWSLMGLTGAYKGKSIPVRGSMIFGRSTNCDIVINDAHMSRRHAELTLSNGTMRIVDLQSSNGTCVNNQKVGERVLRPGDKIEFDHVRFLVVGPLNVDVPEDEEEDEEEATLFRAAPIPRDPKPRRPVEIPAPVTHTSVTEVTSNNKSSHTSRLPWVICGFVVLVGMLAALGVMVL